MMDAADNLPGLRNEDVGPRAMLLDTTLASVVSAFDLGTISAATDIGGTYNLNARLDTARGAFVVRVYRPWTTAERLRSVQQVRVALAAVGLPVPLPVLTPSGESLLIRDGRPIEVERYMAHDHSARDWGDYERAFVHLATLHDALAHLSMEVVPPTVSNYGTPRQLLRMLAHTEARLGAAVPLPEDEKARMICREAGGLLRRLERQWRDAAPALPLQLIHGDYGGDNVLFRDGRIVAVLDFDFLALRERVYDLSYTAYWAVRRLAPDTNPVDWSWTAIARLFARYSEATNRPLTDDEWKALPLTMARVPLYWICEAGYTDNPASAVLRAGDTVPTARWLLSHAEEVTHTLRQTPRP